MERVSRMARIAAPHKWWNVDPPPWAKAVANWWLRPAAPINLPGWTAISVLVIVVASIAHGPLLGLVGLGIFLAALTLRLYWDFCLSALIYTRRFSQERAFWGESVDVTLNAANLKPMPVTHLQVIDRTNQRVRVRDHEIEFSRDTNEYLFESLFSLGMYERVSRQYTLDCLSRGWHRMGPVELVASDPWGLVARTSMIDNRQGVLVYPRMVPVRGFDIAARQPLGDVKPSTPIVEDPMRMSGVRPYVAGDAQKRIHWRATARTGQLQTRVYEPSATPVVAVFLDTQAFSSLWTTHVSEDLELLIVATASMCRTLIRDRVQVGLYANAPVEGSTRSVRVPPGRKSGQLTRMLEKLATLTPEHGGPIVHLVARELNRLPWGATMLIITSDFPPESQRAFLRLARTVGSKRLMFLVIGPEPDLMPAARRAFSVWGRGTEGAWDEITTLGIRRLA